MIATLQGRAGVGGVLASSEFFAPMYDSGAGAVNTALQRGQGAATFTRASTAWTKLSTGLWASVASGTARSSYIGLTTAVGAYGGYFAEGAGTQLVTPTASIRDMNDASWVKVTMSSAKTATGIDGVVNSASTITASGANSTILQTLVAASTSRTYSCWVKRRTGTGTIILKQGTATLDITALINSSTYTMVQLNDNELNVAYGIQINTSGDALDVDFNQFEAGGFATSPMDAAGATRGVDFLTYQLSGNISDTVGSCYSEVNSVGVTSGNDRFVADSVAALGPLINGSTTVVKAAVYDGTTVNATANTGVAGTTYKMATSWGTAGLSACLSGGTVATSAFDGSLGMANAIGICATGVGRSAMQKNILLWLRQLPDSQLKAIAT